MISKKIYESFLEKIIEYADDNGNMNSKENYCELIEAKTSSIKLNTFELRQWKTPHPVSDQIVTGSVVILVDRESSLTVGTQEAVASQVIAAE